MTQEDRAVFSTIMAAIAIAIFGFGFLMAKSFWTRDTFDCVAVCNGAHSVYDVENKTCYCEVTK